MASTGIQRRTISIFHIHSSLPSGAGPYDPVFAMLQNKAPFESEGMLGRKIRINKVEKIDDVWFVELYLLINQLEVLEVSARPDIADAPAFVVPDRDRTFAARTCALFDTESHIAAIEFVLRGPKALDFSEILSSTLYDITREQGANFAIIPKVEEQFIDEINEFERIRQVRAVFERPNPGWADISMLADELEGSNEAKREVTVTAPRYGSISKENGILGFIKRLILAGSTAPITRVLVTGRKSLESGETTASSEKSESKHIVILPRTADESLYRRQFLTAVLPVVRRNENE